jgi:D-alanyl-D-alanine carboxypeptidase/D-alanyl-D-alanine carboxypeptidase (penicillin-binding protein 5/6)
VKKAFVLFLVLLMSFPLMLNNYSAKEITTSASASVLYCSNSDELLYENNANSQMKMASTTKIMTALITLEYAQRNNKVVTFTNEMIEEGSSMYLKVGEKVHLKDLCVGMLLPSGNDAATAAAIAIAGSKEKFAKLMNNRGKKIGMKNTNFVTPSGLDDDNHYSTAYDMALLMRECIKNKDFLEISGSKSKTVDFVNPKDKSVTYQNHNRLLSTYKYCIGGKTGYTMSAGRCLVTVAKKNNVTLIAVTLNDKNDWNDHMSMYEYGFSMVHKVRLKGQKIQQNLVGGEKDLTTLDIKDKVIYTTKENSQVTSKIILPPFAYAPIKKGNKAGMVIYYLGNKEIDREYLIYNENVEIKSDNFIIEFFKGLFKNG